MKKIVKALVLVLAFSLVFTLAGCSTKKAITADKFESIMEDNDYDVSDGSGDDLNSDYDVDEVRYATAQDDYYPYALFVDFDSLSDAKDYYDTATEDMQDTIKDEDLDVKTTSKSSGDYQKYTVKGDDEYGDARYTVVIRVKNTVLVMFMNDDGSSDVKTVDGIISKLGY